MRKDKPSRTAYKVALNILTLGAKPEMDKVLPAGIVDATARLLVASGAASERVVRWHHWPKMVSIYEAFDWMLPGQFEAFAHRKAFCEQQVRDGIDAGATQILVLGAGYDTMGWRLAPNFPDVNFFEIDHPATARLKAKGIKEMGPHDNLHLISEDLGKRKLVDVLKSRDSWDREAQAVIIAEGLLMYLPSQAVYDLFRQCGSISGDGSRIAFTYIGKKPDGRPDAGRWTGFMLWTLKVNGEPWLWSIQPEQIGRVLKENGWTYSPELVGDINKRGVEFFGAAHKSIGTI
ncbi:MAG: class I SAM-dependent methyltransferase [Phycisphaerales bacterium]|nr:MAG: class I SAM-dependent methyltransferase [Phycisphaerales bacterium]